MKRGAGRFTWFGEIVYIHRTTKELSFSLVKEGTTELQVSLLTKHHLTENFFFSFYFKLSLYINGLACVRILTNTLCHTVYKPKQESQFPTFFITTSCLLFPGGTRTHKSNETSE